MQIPIMWTIKLMLIMKPHHQHLVLCKISKYPALIDHSCPVFERLNHSEPHSIPGTAPNGACVQRFRGCTTTRTITACVPLPVTPYITAVTYTITGWDGSTPHPKGIRGLGQAQLVTPVKPHSPYCCVSYTELHSQDLKLTDPYSSPLSFMPR